MLLRALHWSADDTADQVDDLLVICGPPLAPAPQWRRDAATLAHEHKLTFTTPCSSQPRGPSARR